jgi:uncharacterized membrane protein (DUF106 family)
MFETAQPTLGRQGLENLVFMKSIEWFTWYFLLALVALLVFSQMHLATLRTIRERSKNEGESY